MHEKTAFVREDVAGVFQVDYIHDMAMVAVIGEPGFEQVIAVGGYFLDPATNMAEVAYSVDRDWQGRGISTIIQKKLAETAREQGIHGFIAYTDPTNRPMIRLFKKLTGDVAASYEGDMVILKAQFDRPDSHRGPNML